MDAPSKSDLDAVFLGGGDNPPPPMDGPAPPPSDHDGDEMDQALDASIDEIFSTEDPVARREAFKRAIGLCKQGDY